MQVPSHLSGVLKLYQQVVRSSEMAGPHLPGAGPPAAESTPAVVRPPALAHVLMGNYFGIAPARGTPPLPISAIMAQAEVSPAYKAASSPGRKCAENLRRDDDPGVAGRAALTSSGAALLATEAWRRPNKGIAQAQLKASPIRAMCLWHCISGGFIGYQP